MKKFLLALAMSAFAINSYSATSFDTKTFILTIPLVEVDGTPTFSDVKLELISDGSLEIVGGKEYTAPEPPKNGEYMISRINGEFTGWEGIGDTIFELTNGQICKQLNKGGYVRITGDLAFMPRVRITYIDGIFKMTLEDSPFGPNLINTQVIRIK